MKKVVSKSLYTSYKKCELLAWLSSNDVKGQLSDMSKLKTKEGNEFGLLAQNYFGSCIDVAVECNNDIKRMIIKTKELIDELCPNIAEATFKTANGYCQADILHLNDKGLYDMIEVKSSTKAKDYYFDDMAFQYHVIKQCIELDRVYLMYVNNEYRLGDQLTNELFKLEETTDHIKKKEKLIDINKILADVNSKESPQCTLGKHCMNGWECPYIDYCINRLSDKEKELMQFEGLTWIQKMNCINRGELVIPKGKDNLLLKNDDVIIDKKSIRKFLSDIRFPLYLLDFESVQSVIPKYKGQKPWSQTVFQYSLHIVHNYNDLMTMNNIEHKECLITSEQGIDTREVIAKRLIEDIPQNVQIMAYNMSFEKSIIKELATIFPMYSQLLMRMLDNFIDLMLPFKKQYYYKGSMHGSYSIKTVLPTLYPDDKRLDYHNLVDVQNGQQAQIAYKKLIQMEEGNEKDELIHNMLEYCKLDTFSMVKILYVLYQMI